MTNPYFERPASVAAGTTIRSDKYNSDLDTQESAFNALHDKLQHAVFLPEAFSGNPNIPEQTVNDTFIYIDTSGNIALYPIATILEQFDEVNAKHAQIDSWQQQVASNATDAQNAAALSLQWANEAQDVEVQSGLYSARHWAAYAEAQIPLVEAAGQAKVDEAQGHASTASAKASEASTHADSAEDAAQLADNFASYAHNSTIPATGGKYSAYHWAKEAETYAQQTLATVNGDFVPAQRTVNGKALSGNIIINTADIPDIATVAATGSYNDLTDVPVDLLREGDYGLGTTTYAEYPNTDIDEISASSGFYRTTSANTGTFPTSYSKFGYMKVTRYDAASMLQEYTDVFGKMAFRLVKSGDPEEWNEFYTSGNSVNPLSVGVGSEIPPLLDDYDAVEVTGLYRSGAVTHNRPENGQIHTFIHTQYSPAAATQLSFRTNSATQRMFIRSKGALGWTDWVEVYHSGNLNLSNVATSGDYDDLSNKPTAASLGAVTTSRKVNNKALTGDITLNANDVGAIPDTQSGSRLIRVAGSFTATKLAGVTEYVAGATGNTTCTINDSAFSANDKLIISKQYQSGELTLIASIPIYLPDGSNATSHHIPDGIAGTVTLTFTGSAIILRAK